jgi:hypothetical protein
MQGSKNLGLQRQQEIYFFCGVMTPPLRQVQRKVNFERIKMNWDQNNQQIMWGI